VSYSKWFQAHGAKHRKIVEKLSHLSDDEVIEYFRFENMVEQEPNFCPLYAKNQKCHEMENLNCYLCACPNFRFDENGFKTVEGRTLFSVCGIESQDGAEFKTDSAIHQNCTGCIIPHGEKFIRQNFSRDWFEVMSEVT
jgi:hypothetical protein